MTRVEDAPAAQRPGGLAQGDHLGVGGRVGAQLALVVAGADHLAAADDDGADRDVIVFGRPGRLTQSEAHEVLLAREEVGAHAGATVPFEGNFGVRRGVLSVRVRRSPPHFFVHA